MRCLWTDTRDAVQPQIMRWNQRRETGPVCACSYSHVIATVIRGVSQRLLDDFVCNSAVVTVNRTAHSRKMTSNALHMRSSAETRRRILQSL